MNLFIWVGAVLHVIQCHTKGMDEQMQNLYGQWKDFAAAAAARDRVRRRSLTTITCCKCCLVRCVTASPFQHATALPIEHTLQFNQTVTKLHATGRVISVCEPTISNSWSVRLLIAEMLIVSKYNLLSNLWSFRAVAFIRHTLGNLYSWDEDKQQDDVMCCFRMLYSPIDLAWTTKFCCDCLFGRFKHPETIM